MGEEKGMAIMRKYFPIMDTFENSELASKVGNIWYELWKSSEWENIEDADWNPLCPGISLIDHTRSVTQGAVEFAKIRKEMYGERLDFDILLAGALLHDVGKLLELDPGEQNAIKSKKGNLFQHAFLGAHKALIEDLPDEVVHIIISHTGQSRVVPQTPEAVIVYCVDLADADLNRLKFFVPLLMERHK